MNILTRLLLIVASITIAHQALAQYVAPRSNFIERNRTFDINVGYSRLGAVGALRDNRVRGLNGMHAAVRLYGIYFDYSRNTEGDESKNMGIDKYEGYHAYSWHIGYSLPVCDWFKVTPFVGKAVWAQGYWDGGDWVVTDSGIDNNFIPDGWYHKGLDVGIELNFTIATYLNIFINATTYNIGFGLGGSIPFRMFDKHL